MSHPITQALVSGLALVVASTASAQCVDDYRQTAASNRDHVHANNVAIRSRTFLSDFKKGLIGVDGLIYATVRIPYRNRHDRIDGYWRDVGIVLAQDQESVARLFEEARHRYGPSLVQFVEELRAEGGDFTVEQVAKILHFANLFNLHCLTGSREIYARGVEVPRSRKDNLPGINTGLRYLPGWDEIKKEILSGALSEPPTGTQTEIDRHWSEQRERRRGALVLPTNPQDKE